MVGAKRFCGGATGDRLQDRRLHLPKPALLKKAPGLANNRDAFCKDFPRTLVGEKIKITLAIARLNVLQSVPFLRERPQGLGQQLKRPHFQRRLTGFREKARSLDANKITDI